MTTTCSAPCHPTGIDLADETLLEAAAEVRQRMLTCCALSEVGHVGGCAGAVELLVALYLGGVLRYDPNAPRCPSRDRLLFRGHLGPTRYAIFSLLGWLDPDDLASHATLGSLLEGHETVALPGVDIGPSGSLGMVLSQGAGAAMAAQDDGRRTFVLLGDGEEQEGNVAEAARDAAAASLTGLVVVIDANGRQLSGSPTSADATDVPGAWRAYGWRVIELAEGNDVVKTRDILRVAAEAARHGPVAVVAHTVKGHGLPGAAHHYSGYHELAHCPPGLVQAAPIDRSHPVSTTVRAHAAHVDELCPSLGPAAGPPSREHLGQLDLLDETWAALAPDDFQLAFLAALAEGWSDRLGTLYFLYADTFPEPLLERTGLADAARCRNVGIREQHLVALAHGLSVTDPKAVVVIHTGDAFVPRAIDQLNAAAIGGGRFVLLADDAGITNCRNGVSHQSALTSRLVAAVPEITVVEPADGVDFALAVSAALGHAGITYVRVHDSLIRHPITAPASGRATGWYEASASTGSRPDVALLASGFVVGEALGAAELLAEAGIDAAVVNVVQPASAEAAARPLLQGGVPIVTVYDGHPDTLADPVRRAMAATPDVGLASLGYLRGRSGRLEELLSWADLDDRAIATTATVLLTGHTNQQVPR